MSKTETLTKAQIIDNIAEATGFTRIKSIETTEIMQEPIKFTLASGEDLFVSDFGKFCGKKESKTPGQKSIHR